MTALRKPDRYLLRYSAKAFREIEDALLDMDGA